MSYPVRRAPRAEDVVVRGLRHRLTWWGEPGPRPIVLLHGWMDAGATWQFLVDCLPREWSCVALDWRGFGASERQADGYWFPDYLADLEALLEHVAPDGRPGVIGHSMGGNIGALYAGVRTERLAWLVNLEGFGLARTSVSRAPERYAQWLDQLREVPPPRRYESVARLALALRVRNPRLGRDKAEFIARAWTRPAERGVELAADPRHRIVNPTLYRREEAEACWSRIRIPMLLLLGEHSEYIGRLGADGTDERLRAVFPGVRLERLAGVGHMMHHEDPALVARHIERFVADVA